MSKTFLVEWAEPEASDERDDDEQSFIMEERRPRSSLRVSMFTFLNPYLYIDLLLAVACISACNLHEEPFR